MPDVCCQVRDGENAHYLAQHASVRATDDAAWQAAIDQYAPQVAAIQSAIDTTNATADQAADSAMDQADAAQAASNLAADTLYNTTTQAADNTLNVTSQAADDTYAAAENAANTDFSSQAAAATVTLNGQLAAHQTTFDNTSNSLQATHDTNVAADVAAMQATISADQAAFNATQASLDSAMSSQSSTLLTQLQNALSSNFVSAGLTSSVPNDPNYQADVQAAQNSYNNQILALTNTQQQAYSQADTTMGQKISDATNQQAADILDAQNAYNVLATDAEDQYATNQQAAATIEQNTFNSDEAAYEAQVASVTATYNTSVAGVMATMNAAIQGANNTYATNSQNAQNAFNTWAATRGAIYNSDVQARQTQLAADQQTAQAAHDADVAGYALTDTQADQAAVNTYNNAVAGFQTTKDNADAGAYQTCDTTMQPARQAEQDAEDNYQQTVMQIYMDAEQSGNPPDQGALDAALATVEAARKAFAVASAGAAAAATTTLAADAMAFWNSEEPAWVSEQDAIATNDAAYVSAVAARDKVLVDTQADNEAGANADLANLQAAYSNDIAQHQGDLQQQLAALAKTRDDTIADAVRVEADQEVDFWATEQQSIGDATQTKGKQDADAVGVYQNAIAGFWQTAVGLIATAQQQLIHAEAVAKTAASDKINQAEGQDEIDHAAADVAFNVGQAAAWSQYLTTTVQDWTSTLVGYAPNDPNVAAVAVAINSYVSSMASLAASQAGQLSAAQQSQISLDVAAIELEAHQEAVEDQNLADGIAQAAVQQTNDDAGSQVAFAGTITSAAVTDGKAIVDAARTAFGSMVVALVADTHATIGANATKAHSYLANAATWVASVVPAVVAAQVTANNEAAAEAGQAYATSALIEKKWTAADVAQINATLQVYVPAIDQVAQAQKTLNLDLFQGMADAAVQEANQMVVDVTGTLDTDYVQVPSESSIVPVLMLKSEAPFPFNIMSDAGKGMSLTVYETALYNRMPTLQGAIFSAEAIMGESREITKLLVRMQNALNTANDTWSETWRNARDEKWDRPLAQTRPQISVRSFAFWRFGG